MGKAMWVVKAACSSEKCSSQLHLNKLGFWGAHKKGCQGTQANCRCDSLPTSLHLPVRCHWPVQLWPAWASVVRESWRKAVMMVTLARVPEATPPSLVLEGSSQIFSRSSHWSIFSSFLAFHPKPASSPTCGFYHWHFRQRGTELCVACIHLTILCLASICSVLIRAVSELAFLSGFLLPMSSPKSWSSLGSVSAQCIGSSSFGVPSQSALLPLKDLLWR